MSQSQKMRKALEEYVIPDLLSKGFVGKYPHYKKIYDDRIELLAFFVNKWGNSFNIEISTIFLPPRKRDSNFASVDFVRLEDATVFDTNLRYRLKGTYDGWFYYTDLYRKRSLMMTFYNAVSETKAKEYIPKANEKLVQKADDGIYYKVCESVNKQMKKAYKWWDAFNKNEKFRMKLLEIF